MDPKDEIKIWMKVLDKLDKLDHKKKISYLKMMANIKIKEIEIRNEKTLLNKCLLDELEMVKQ